MRNLIVALVFALVLFSCVSLHAQVVYSGPSVSVVVPDSVYIGPSVAVRPVVGYGYRYVWPRRAWVVAPPVAVAPVAPVTVAPSVVVAPPVVVRPPVVRRYRVWY